MIRTEKGRLFEVCYEKEMGKETTIEKTRMNEGRTNGDQRVLGFYTNSHTFSKSPVADLAP